MLRVKYCLGKNYGKQSPFSTWNSGWQVLWYLSVNELAKQLRHYSRDKAQRSMKKKKTVISRLPTCRLGRCRFRRCFRRRCGGIDGRCGWVCRCSRRIGGRRRRVGGRCRGIGGRGCRRRRTFRGSRSRCLRFRRRDIGERDAAGNQTQRRTGGRQNSKRHGYSPDGQFEPRTAKPSSRYFNLTTVASNQDARHAVRTHNLKPAEKLCRKSRFGIALLPAHDSAAESESDSVPHIE